MLQREVADRIVAKPGTPEYGVLSVLVQWRADVTRLLAIPPGAFRPPPDVRSALIRLDVPAARRFSLQDPRAVRADGARACSPSGARRWRNALAPFAVESGRRAGRRRSADAGIDPRRRPETLEVVEIARLADVFAAARIVSCAILLPSPQAAPSSLVAWSRVTAHHDLEKAPRAFLPNRPPGRRASVSLMAPALQVVPLGGLGEFGMNSMAVSTDRTTLVIDAGVMFAGPELPGVDLLIPDLTYLQQCQPRPAALLLTHGHEDHIGGVPYVWPLIDGPVYGTPLTLALLRPKLEEHGIDPGDRLVRGSAASARARSATAKSNSCA